MKKILFYILVLIIFVNCSTQKRFHHNREKYISKSLISEINTNKHFLEYNRKHKENVILVSNKSKYPSSEFDFGIPTPYGILELKQSEIPNKIDNYKIRVQENIEEYIINKKNYQFINYKLISIHNGKAKIKIKYNWKYKGETEQNSETVYEFEKNKLITNCNNNGIIAFGGDFNFTDYSFNCSAYKFSENGDATSKWNVLNHNHIGKISKEINPIKNRLERKIKEYSGNKFYNKLEFYSVSVNYPDSISKFKNVSGVKNKNCKAKYFFYYYFKPKKNVKYCIGIPINNNGEIMSKFNFPSKENYKNIDKKLDVCEVARLSREYNKNIEPISEISFEFDDKTNNFYWLITQKGKHIKRMNGHFVKYNVVKIDASNGSLISTNKVKGRVFPNTRFF